VISPHRPIGQMLDQPNGEALLRLCIEVLRDATAIANKDKLYRCAPSCTDEKPVIFATFGTGNLIPNCGAYSNELRL
jgi:hypothetical protein